VNGASVSASGAGRSATAAGPSRVLTNNDKHARIVQRREKSPGGQGTKFTLNLALRDECR